MSSQKSAAKQKIKKGLHVVGVITKWLAFTVMIVLFIGFGVCSGYLASLLKNQPVISTASMLKQMQSKDITGYAYFHNGKEIGQLSTFNHQPATLHDIPDLVITALLSVENHNFYQDYGISIQGTLRAAMQHFLHSSVQTGGSTITQQLVKNLFLTDNGTLKYKARQIFLALRATRIMTKNQILLAYLNKVAFGDNNQGHYLYGIQSAAKGIFGIQDLNELKKPTPRNIAIAAYLVGLPQNPNTYSAYDGYGNFNPSGFKAAIARQHLVLSRMHDLHKITDTQYQAAIHYDIRKALAQPSAGNDEKYPYLMTYVENQAVSRFMQQQHPNLKPGDKGYAADAEEMRHRLETGGYKIYTTVDKTIYDAMQAIAQNPKNFSSTDKVKGDEQTGAVMIQNHTGKILGMIAGRGYAKNKFNYAVQAYRSPGSSMKPIAAYGPAMQEGKLQPASIIYDAPIILPDGRQKYFIPKNWDDKYHGIMTARHALNESYNIPAIKIFLNDVGIKNAWDHYAKKMGITSLTPQDYHSATGAIGGLTKGVNVLEMTSAYTTFANQGVHPDAYIISKIVDSSGNIVYQHAPKPTRVFSPQTAYLMTSMLQTVISNGTGGSLTRWGANPFKYYGKIDIAGKTGSTDGNGDVWFVGYTPDVTLGVWAGYNSPKYELSSRATVGHCPKVGCGDHRALDIWSQVMSKAATVGGKYFPDKKFKKPDHIVTMTVSSTSGLLPSELDKKTNRLNTDIFNQSDIPTQMDSSLVQLNVVKYNGDYYLPQPSTPADMQQTKLLVKVKEPFDVLKPKLAAALKVIPPSQRMPMSSYRPLDEKWIAPQTVDPRKEDGKVPDAPTNVKLTQTGKQDSITFTSSPNADVAGYRLYQSIRNGPFQKVKGKVVLTGDPDKFTVNAAPGNFYYITAVDVGGKESKPSPIVSTDGSRFSSTPNTPQDIQVSSIGIGIMLTWKADPAGQNITKYTIYYSPKKDGVYRKIGTSSSNNFTDYAVQNGYFEVTASNVLGESAPSKPIPYRAKSA